MLCELFGFYWFFFDAQNHRKRHSSQVLLCNNWLSISTRDPNPNADPKTNPTCISGRCSEKRPERGYHKHFKLSQWLKCRPDGTIAAKLKYHPDGISLKNLQYRQDGTVAAKL